MKILKATRKYETWLREALDVFEEDLARKAQKLAEDPFTFLRGTFYRWMQVFPGKSVKVTGQSPRWWSCEGIGFASNRFEARGWIRNRDTTRRPKPWLRRVCHLLFVNGSGRIIIDSMLYKIGLYNTPHRKYSPKNQFFDSLGGRLRVKPNSKN